MSLYPAATNGHDSNTVRRSSLEFCTQTPAINNLPRSGGTLTIAALTTREILVKSLDFYTHTHTPAFHASLKGVPVGILP